MLPKETTSTSSSSSTNTELMSKAETHHVASDFNGATVDAFVSSMTFAGKRNRHEMGCDCCDEVAWKDGSTLMIPNAIQEAIACYKRTRPTLKRTQTRQLVRQRSVHPGTMLSIWKWTLPHHAEPLLEFGNNHRIVLVHRLDAFSQLQHIGTGIVGSGAEQQGRQSLPTWTAGTAHWVASRQGKAVGWVHEEQHGKNDPSVSGPAVLYMIKVPPSLLQAKIPSDDEELEWCRVIQEVAQRAQRQQQQCTDDQVLSTSGVDLHESDFERLHEICVSFES